MSYSGKRTIWCFVMILCGQYTETYCDSFHTFSTSSEAKLQALCRAFKVMSFIFLLVYYPCLKTRFSENKICLTLLRFQSRGIQHCEPMIELFVTYSPGSCSQVRISWPRLPEPSPRRAEGQRDWIRDCELCEHKNEVLPVYFLKLSWWFEGLGQQSCAPLSAALSVFNELC